MIDTSAVSLGSFPITLVGRRFALSAWHCRWEGLAHWLYLGQPWSTKVKLAGRVGNNLDIAVLLLAKPCPIPPVRIVPCGAGFFRDALNRLLPATTVERSFKSYYWASFPLSTGLADGDSASPHLVDLGGETGLDTLASSASLGPALYHYRAAIERLTGYKR